MVATVIVSVASEMTRTVDTGDYDHPAAVWNGVSCRKRQRTLSKSNKAPFDATYWLSHWMGGLGEAEYSAHVVGHASKHTQLGLLKPRVE